MEFFKAILLACGSAFVTGIFTLIISSVTYKREQKKLQEANNEKIQKELNELKIAMGTNNEQVRKELNELKIAMEVHTADDERNRVEDGRTRFLRFCDEVRRGILHTEEHWKDILKDIDRYENYCRNHKNYKNECAVRTIDYLIKTYDEHIQNNTFLGGKANETER